MKKLITYKNDGLGKSIKSKIRIFRYCRLVILLIGILININLINAGLYYNSELYYNKGEISINSVAVEFSNYELENYANEELFLVYSLKIFDRDGEVLDESFFNVPNKQIYDIVDNETDIIIAGGEIRLDKVSFNIYAPYYENTKEIVIYNENKKELTRRDISEFSKDYVKDSKIIKGEKDEYGCLIDAGYSWCELKQKCLKAWEEKCGSETGREKSKFDILNKIRESPWILVIVLAVLIIVFIYLIKKEKEKVNLQI